MTTRRERSEEAAPQLAPGRRATFLAGADRDPHAVLGAHEVPGGVLVRAFHPDAAAAFVLREGAATVRLERDGDEGLFAAVLTGASLPLAYRLRFSFADGNVWEVDDPYRFLPSCGELDLHLLGEGRHQRPWDVLGAVRRVLDGTEGVAFATWAPNARGVALCSDAWHFDARLRPLRAIGSSGVFELFVPGLPEGAAYKFLVHGADGVRRFKADPWGRTHERLPGTASRVFTSGHAWEDQAWREARRTKDWTREAIVACEVHAGSFVRVPEEGHRPLTYRELAPQLADHALGLGFTHVELMPIMEHPFDASWGYQVSGYFAPTSRFGDPDDFRFLVDHLHGRGLGVILDWVPGHFVKDDHGLLRYDGTALYEHADPARGEHPDWGTAVFDHGRREVRNFLLANALWWLEEFHVDGLRVDAVASMLYRNYSRREGEWTPNVHGSHEDLEAISLLREVNEALRQRHPDCFTMAEESTSWPGVTRAVKDGGLGFTFKWNLGWMHDTLAYFQTDPPHRPGVHDRLTFAMLYEHAERFVNPLSHDEVVHEKGSLLGKMPGDEWQRFASLRCLLAYQRLRPGKTLLFMGTELAPEREWNHDESLPWHLAEEPQRKGLRSFLEELGRLHLASPASFGSDPDSGGFEWISCDDRAQSVLAFLRQHGSDVLVVVLNLSLVPRAGYRIGLPRAGRWAVVLDSDEARHGGNGLAGKTPRVIHGEERPLHGRAVSAALDLPPLAVLVLRPE